MLGGFLFAILIFSGGTDAFMTDGHCEDMIINQSNITFQYGIGYGIEYSKAMLTQEAIQCNQIPMNYSNYTYTLIAAECLNLNNQGGNK